MKLTEEKIASIKENIFYRSRDSITDYRNFEWHTYRNNIDSDKVNSSQALAIDFWGCLQMSPHKNQIINYVFDKDCKEWQIILEYEDSALLHEKKSTQIDILLVSKSNAIFIESKFKEKNGGPCSQPQKRSKRRQCNGNYEKQTNPINNIKSYCALSGKGIKYWDYIDRLTSFNKNTMYQPCPIRLGEFQWIRNICFAQAYAEKNNKTSETFLVYYKSEKCPISIKVEEQTYLGKLNGMLKNSRAFSPLSYNELLDTIILFLQSQDLDEWKVWMELKKWMEQKADKL